VKKSKAIALTLLGLGASTLTTGCGGESKNERTTVREGAPPEQAPVPPRPDDADLEPTDVEFNPVDEWFDKDGNPIAKEWVDGGQGKKVPANPPHDRLGRAWVNDENGNLVPPPPTTVYARPFIGGMVLFFAGGGDRQLQLIRPPRGGLAALDSSPTLRPRGSSTRPTAAMSPTISKGGFGTIGGAIVSPGG
jgi:hypothetical protein